MNVVKHIRGWSIAGFFVIAVLGGLYHYVYDWTNRSCLIGAFVPVNESVWEHFKLGLWAVITFSVFEYIAVGKMVSNFFFAKAIGVWVITITILFVYSFYTMFTETNVLILDIGSYVMGVLLCQVFCYRMFQKEHHTRLNRFGIILLTITCLLFGILTYYPPHLEIFRDKNTDTYGTELRNNNHRH